VTAPRPRALVVEDEFLIAEGFRAQLEAMGIEVCGTATSADAAIDIAERSRPSIVLMDMRLQGAKDGVDAALAIHDRLGAKIIFITGSKEPATVARIHIGHPSAILFKPISDRQFRAAVEAAAKSLSDAGV